MNICKAFMLVRAWCQPIRNVVSRAAITVFYQLIRNTGLPKLADLTGHSLLIPRCYLTSAKLPFCQHMYPSHRIKYHHSVLCLYNPFYLKITDNGIAKQCSCHLTLGHQKYTNEPIYHHYFLKNSGCLESEIAALLKLVNT